MKLKKLGFYKELKYGDGSAQNMTSVMTDSIREYEAEIIKYLSTGVLLIASSGISKDVIGKEIIGSPDLLTDGEWCWCKDLIHYIRHYHLILPPEFVKGLVAKKFRMAKLTNEDLENLEL